ncbi:MAG: putative abductin-like protein [Myxococcaceae bacterium]|nr:putative abductin-like protein [Myxococcaceae bacterium]
MHANMPRMNFRVTAVLLACVTSACGGDPPKVATPSAPTAPTAPAAPTASPVDSSSAAASTATAPSSSAATSATTPSDAGAGAHAPSLRQGAVTTVEADLSTDAIQRVVRQHFGAFRKCYEDGLGRDKALAGKVVVRFDVAADGHAGAAAKEAGTDLKDDKVVTCVLQPFAGLTFPPPKKKVTVTYPIIFAP